MMANKQHPRYPDQKNTSAKKVTQKRSDSMYQNFLFLYFIRHVDACINSLGRLSRTPFATLMTMAVIGVSLALPMGLFLLLNNMETLGQQWDNTAQVSLFLKQDVGEIQARDLTRELQQEADIAETQYISPQQGLQEFEEMAGFQGLLDALPDNPLPGVIIVKPKLDAQSAIAMQQLLNNLRGLPEVDIAQLDMQWMKRFFSILELGRHAVLALAFLLGLGVCLVVWNTIRLSTQNSRKEIEVIKLFGASNSFVRRPFLYIGMFYGLFGGVIAWLLVDAVLLWLRQPVANLAQLYNSQYYLAELGLPSVAILLITGALLGLIGSYVALGRHLSYKH